MDQCITLQSQQKIEQASLAINDLAEHFKRLHQLFDAELARRKEYHDRQRSMTILTAVSMALLQPPPSSSVDLVDYCSGNNKCTGDPVVSEEAVESDSIDDNWVESVEPTKEQVVQQPPTVSFHSMQTRSKQAALNKEAAKNPITSLPVPEKIENRKRPADEPQVPIDIPPSKRERLSLSERSAKGALACDQCSMSFKKPFFLKRHQRIHSGAKPFVCSYPKCTHATAQKSNLMNHIKVVHFRMPITADGQLGTANNHEARRYITTLTELL